MELIGSIETVAVLSRWCGAWVVLAVRLRRCRRAGGFQDILQDFYVRSNVCLSWSIAYSDPIRFRGVCALIMYVFRHGGLSCLYMRLGVLCLSWVWGSVWIKSEVVYIAETVRSQRAVFAFVCARAC